MHSGESFGTEAQVELFHIPTNMTLGRGQLLCQTLLNCHKHDAQGNSLPTARTIHI
jgi:hypothetical protein